MWDGRRFLNPSGWGGLGIRTARETNTAMLGKLVWDMQCNSEKLWVQMMTNKYVKGVPFLQTPLRYGSPTWNSIFKAKEALKEGSHFRVGNGESLFWYSPWTQLGPLCE